MEMEMKMKIAMLLTCAMAFEGSAQDTSCMNTLIPCLNYLNGSRHPPESCCNPLRSVIESNPYCLCSLISKEGSNRAEQAGIDINEAQLLPGRCGQHVNPISCLITNNARSISTDGVFNFAAAMTVVTVIAIMSAITI